MFETTSELSLLEHQSEAAVTSEQFSLPLITKKPVSRRELTTRKGITQKQKFLLPSIYASQRQISQPDTQFDKQNVQNINKAPFVKEIKEKLNMVLGEMHQMQSLQQDQYESNDSNFLEKINENKQIIKQHRLKKESENINLIQPNHKNLIEVKSKKFTKLRNVPLYQKKAKQQKYHSVENKYSLKRKPILHQKMPFSKNHLIKELKQKNEGNFLKQDKKSMFKKNEARAMSLKLFEKNTALQQNKNTNFFDSIQNYLQNPRQYKKKQIQKPLVGLTLLKAKRDLEDKIKVLNEKLGIVEHEQQRKQRIQTMDMQASAKDWRRIQLRSQKVKYQPSSFDKELDRINSLQERSSICLEKYLQHQKMLVDIEFLKKQLSCKLHLASK